MQTSPGVGSNTPQKPSYLLQKLHVIPSPPKYTHMQEVFHVWINYRKAPTALAGCDSDPHLALRVYQRPLGKTDPCPLHLTNQHYFTKLVEFVAFFLFKVQLLLKNKIKSAFYAVIWTPTAFNRHYSFSEACTLCRKLAESPFQYNWKHTFLEKI